MASTPCSRTESKEQQQTPFQMDKQVLNESPSVSSSSATYEARFEAARSFEQEDDDEFFPGPLEPEKTSNDNQSVCPSSYACYYQLMQRQQNTGSNQYMFPADQRNPQYSSNVGTSEFNRALYNITTPLCNTTGPLSKQQILSLIPFMCKQELQNKPCTNPVSCFHNTQALHRCRFVEACALCALPNCHNDMFPTWDGFLQRGVSVSIPVVHLPMLCNFEMMRGKCVDMRCWYEHCFPRGRVGY